MAPPCIQTLFSRKPRSVQAQQRVDRDTSGADQEFLHSVDPSSLSEWLPDDGQGFAMSKCAAVDRVNLPYCETFTTSHGKPDVLDLRAALWSSHTSRTSQNNTSKTRCSAAVQFLATGEKSRRYEVIIAG